MATLGDRMVTVYDVDANKLIGKVADKLKEMGLNKPEFVDYVKSGAHVERPPEQPNFFYWRAAVILRKAYTDGRIGTNRLRKALGGRKNRGLRPEHKVKAGGKIIRVAMQELERLGLLQKAEDGKGRVLTGKGRSLLDNTAKEVSNAQ